jgi:hypothetical protein
MSFVEGGDMADDVFASCNEDIARAEMRHGLFEWEAQAELSPGRFVTLGITWQPACGERLPDLVAVARAAWERLQPAEEFHRRAAVNEVNGSRRWFRIRAEDLFSQYVGFLPDGAVEVSYVGIETGGHGFTVEISPAGQYFGYRVE